MIMGLVALLCALWLALQRKKWMRAPVVFV